MTDNNHATPAIEVTNLRTAFGKNVIHDGLNLTVHRGEKLTIIGGSGSGKTVLLRHLIGLNRPASGSIHVFGEPLFGGDAQHMLALRRRWGVCFQAGALFSAMTVLENIAQPLKELRYLPDSIIERIAMANLLQSGLKVGDANKYPSDLSGGMIKRVALARALALDPDLLFMDEPTAGLDPASSDAFVELLQSLHAQRGFTVVMITHDLDTLIALSDRVAVLADKKLITCGPIPDVIKVDHPFIKNYFLGERGLRALEALPTR